MPDNSTAVAKRDNSPVGQFQQMLQERARDIQMALPSHITPDKFQRTVLTAVAQNPDLLKADRGSLILSIYKAAQDGLLPDGREAALVTFNTRFKDPQDGQWKSRKLVQYMPMVYGLRKKILQSGDVVALEVAVVYKIEQENGYFRYEVGTEPPLNYAPMLDIPDEEATDDKIIAAFSIATMKDGTKSYEVMRRSEINKVRQVSQTGALGRTDRSGKAIEPKGPWVDWFAEMAKKTVMRRHSKTLPQSGDVVFDVEDRGLDPAKSAAWALSAHSDEPTLITDDSGNTIDSETGEVLSEGNGDAGGDTESSTAQPKAEQGNGQTSATAKGSDPASQSSGSGDSDDEAGDNDDHPGKKIAEDLLTAFSTAKNVVELRKLYDGAVLDIASMRDEHANAVETGYDRNLKRLGTTRDKVTAPAKVAAE